MFVHPATTLSPTSLYTTRRNSNYAAIPFVFQLVATILSGLDYYQTTDGSHRMLGAASGGGSTNHIPMVLTLAGPVIYQVIFAINAIFFFPSDGSHKKMSKWAYALPCTRVALLVLQLAIL
jgi:hypothetical protein